MSAKQESPRPEPRVYSFMPVENTERRKKITKICRKAGDELYQGYLSGAVARAQKLYGKLAKVDGILEISEGDVAEDHNNHYGSLEYVFGGIKNEDWMNEWRQLHWKEHDGVEREDQVYRNLIGSRDISAAEEFLLRKGYALVNGEPQVGDVVAYGYIKKDREGNRDGSYSHYGVFMGDHVTSKFFEGPIVKHAIDAIPFDGEDGHTNRVNSAVFFRKIVPGTSSLKLTQELIWQREYEARHDYGR